MKKKTGRILLIVAAIAVLAIVAANLKITTRIEMPDTIYLDE